jgi:nitrogen-specific signal transduction histidine kinase
MAQLFSALAPTPTAPQAMESDVETRAVVRQLCHEIRQPLSTIESAAYYLQLIAPNDVRFDRELERIQQMAYQANWILADVVHYIQATPPRMEWVDLGECVTGTISSLIPAMARVEFSCPEDRSATLTLIDPAQAQHLVRAILSVFRQIARNDESVRINLGRRGERIVLNVRCRADERLCEFAEDLMQPFTPHLPAGSGLALASVRRIAEVHQGSAQVEARDGMLVLEVALPAH